MAEFRPGSQIRDSFANPFEFFGERGRVRTRLKRKNGASSRRACGAARDNLAEARKFEEFFGAAAHLVKMAEDPARVKEASNNKSQRATSTSACATGCQNAWLEFRLLLLATMRFRSGGRRLLPMLNDVLSQLRGRVQSPVARIRRERRAVSFSSRFY